MATNKDLLFTLLGRDVSASSTLDKVGDAAARLERRMDSVGKMATKSLATLGASAGAGVAVAGGLALATAGFAAFGVMALRTNADVVASWSNLADTVKAGAQEAAAPLEGRLVSAAGKLQSTFVSLEPLMARGFKAAGPSIDHLVDGVDQFARRAMPGAVLAVERGEPVFVGFRELLTDLGDGTGDFFEGVSDGAESSGRILGNFGEIAKDTLGFTGRLMSGMADNAAPSVSQLAVTYGHLLSTIEKMSGSGMPVLFSTATSVLGVLDKMLSVVEPLAPALGTVVGVMLTARAGATIFGAAGDAVSRYGAKLETSAESGGRAASATAKLGSALGAIGPWGAIAGGALLGVSAAADKAFGSVDQLTAGLMAGGNAAAEANRQLGQNDILDKAVGKYAALGGVIQQFVTTTGEANAAVSDQRSTMSSLERAQVDATAAANDHSRAVELYGVKSNEAQAAAAILVMRQKDLRTAQAAAADATKTLTEKLLEQQQAALLLANENLALRVATRSYEDAQKKAAEAVKTYGRNSREATDAIMDQEQAALQLVAAAGNEALAHHANKESAEAQTAALNATNAKALELAASLEGPVPAALAQLIANMDNSSLAALGATKAIDGTNNAVITLKDGKTIVIKAADYASATIAGIQTNVDNLRGKTIEVHIRQLVSTSGPPMANLGNPLAVLPARAAGGPVYAGQTYITGEKGIELFTPEVDGYIHDNNATRRMLAGSGGGGAGGFAGGSTVRVAFDFGSGAGLSGLERLFWQWLKESARARGEVVTR